MSEKAIETLKNFLFSMSHEEVKILNTDGQGESFYLTFILFKESELENEQLGYSVDEQGNSLIGKSKGDWQEGWIVIGYEEDLGDPLIVDTVRENYPVLTAEHGAGEWEPIILFHSLHDLIKSIS
ncbi:hypothetical protein [Sporosarcina sp. HYO08]|uniref:hypothetical protein n=1 Tax=Sporosarcina sp. HYO08 TaxID=1759557 RepID=UPI0007969EDC|nr:hypothetical protein [Sporosarcina sp. HYO08]KXH87242.1 hypothetical protein AU377_01325 [Sporosarcina sp. HYO08]